MPNIQKHVLNTISKIKKNLSKILILIFSLMLGILVLHFKDNLKMLAGYGYLGIFILSILGNSTIVIPAPVFLTALVGGSVYNPIIVGILTAIGATIGETISYSFGYGGKFIVEENKNYKILKKYIDKNISLVIFVLAAVPNPLFDLAGIYAGIVNYPFKYYLIYTFLGKSVKYMFLSLLGKFTL